MVDPWGSSMFAIVLIADFTNMQINDDNWRSI